MKLPVKLQVRVAADETARLLMVFPNAVFQAGQYNTENEAYEEMELLEECLLDSGAEVETKP